jgi:iron complex outermembrane receptor protein
MSMNVLTHRSCARASSMKIACMAAALVNSATVWAAVTDAVADPLAEVIVTGTRESGRIASDSATPIDVISGERLLTIGQTDLRDALEQLSPSIARESFNTNSAALTDILTLHGLSPNHLLVLINGKRRHSTASVDTDGPQQGQTGVDIDTIPISAIDHIEVLRDGDSAQYGADAIAGVINVILKSSNHGGSAQATAGEYYAGDGFSRQVSGDAGFDLGGRGFVHLSAEYSGKNFTDRNGVDPRTGEHTNTFEGNPRNNTESLGINTAYELSDNVELYGFATYAHREGAGKELWRLPSFLPAVYPDGFLPLDTRREDDYGITGGIRGKDFFGWSWDASSTFGRDTVNVGLINSVNPDFYAAFGYTPTNFHISTFNSSQWTNSLDLTRPVSIAFLPHPLTISWGLEHRRESYKIGSGDYASYYNGGPQALAGIAPADASDHSRNVAAAYLDLSTKLTSRWQVDLAGRFEHYWGIGSNETGKIATRYDFSPKVAVRASFGTGFQAPSLAQEYFSSLVVGPTEAVGQLSPLSPIAKSLGATPLKPEESTNINLGLVLNPIDNLTATIDVYQVVVRDRLIDSGYAEGATAADALAAGGIVLPSTATYISTNYLQNAADTRTRGADIAITYRTNLEQYGIVDWSISANLNDTKLLRVATVGGLPVTNAQQDAWLTSVTPEYKVIAGATWHKESWAVSLREHIYGHASDQVTIYEGPNTFSTTVFDRFDQRARATTDLSVGYSFVPNLTLTVGANNVFNAYPDRMAAQDQYLGWQYDGYISQMGINGGFYYASLKYSF